MREEKNKVWVSAIRDLLDVKGKLLGREISPEELAHFVGVSRQTVYTWMSDDGVPTISANKTAGLMEFFGVPEWRLWKLVDATSKEDDPTGQRTAEAVS